MGRKRVTIPSDSATNRENEGETLLKMKDYYRKEIIKLLSSIDNLSVLEWLYHFIKDGKENRW